MAREGCLCSWVEARPKRFFDAREELCAWNLPSFAARDADEPPPPPPPPPAPPPPPPPPLPPPPRCAWLSAALRCLPPPPASLSASLQPRPVHPPPLEGFPPAEWKAEASSLPPLAGLHAALRSRSAVSLEALLAGDAALARLALEVMLASPQELTRALTRLRGSSCAPAAPFPPASHAAPASHSFFAPPYSSDSFLASLYAHGKQLRLAAWRPSATASAVAHAVAEHHAFTPPQLREVLSNYADSDDAELRAALSASHLHFLEEALALQLHAEATAHGVRALAHAEASIEADGFSALGHVWYGQALLLHAAAAHGPIAQAAALARALKSWETAHELQPAHPLPLHLLGAFAFASASLPAVAHAALLRLSPGLKQYGLNEAFGLLRRSEELQPPDAHMYTVANSSYIGRIYCRLGETVRARTWLRRAVDEERMPSDRLDAAALGARHAAAQALKSLQ